MSSLESLQEFFRGLISPEIVLIAMQIFFAVLALIVAALVFVIVRELVVYGLDKRAKEDRQRRRS